MNTSYSAIITEYASWLDTLGFSKGVIQSYPRLIEDFFDWLENRQIHSIDLLNNKHITEYHSYLETRPNRRYKGRLLSVSYLNDNFIAVDKLLEFLHQHGATTAPIPTNHRITPDNQERIRKITPLTQQEIKTLYNCIPETYPNLPFAHRQAKHYELKLIFALYYA